MFYTEIMRGREVEKKGMIERREIVTASGSDKSCSNCNNNSRSRSIRRHRSSAVVEVRYLVYLY